MTILSQCLGLSILLVMSYSSGRVNLLAHSGWFFFGAVSCFVFYHYRNILGYAGGLSFACFSMSITPVVLHRAASTGMLVNTYLTAMFVYCLLSLASVWTVAYAFVPAGSYLRERTDL